MFDYDYDYLAVSIYGVQISQDMSTMAFENQFRAINK